MHKQNVLFVIDSLGIGGAEKATLTLAEGFLKKGFHVDLIVCDPIVSFEVPKGISLHILGFQKSFMDYTLYAKKLHTMIRALAHKNAAEYVLILVALQKATKLMRGYAHPHIYHCVHSTLSQSAFANRHGLRLFLKRRSLQKIYDGLHIIAVSNGIKEDLVHTIGISPESIQTIYNPIDLEHISKQALEANPIKEENYIVHVGRLHSVKRHDILLKAFALANLDTKLVLVGDGSERENIEKLIQELHLQNRVILSGFIQNPYPIIKQAKLLVLSSQYEGLPTVLIEALMLGTPVVSTNCKSGPDEILKGEYKKYLVEVNNSEALSQTMREVYHHPYFIETSMTEEFYLQKVLQRYLSL
jgi:glycosyltransferase involved in cell wall biosynthesis